MVAKYLKPFYSYHFVHDLYTKVCDVRLVHGESFSLVVGIVKDILKTSVTLRQNINWRNGIPDYFFKVVSLFALVTSVNFQTTERNLMYILFLNYFPIGLYIAKICQLWWFLKTRNCFLKNDCWYKASLFQVYMIMIIK